MRIVASGRRYAYTIGYRLGGAITLAIGTAHFALPRWGYDAGMLASIPAAARDHFAYLGTYAIGLLLVGAGIMSLYLAKLDGGPAARLFALLQMLFWAGRFLLEVTLPSHVRIFFLADPPAALCTVSAIAFAGYAAALLASAAARGTNRSAPPRAPAS